MNVKYPITLDQFITKLVKLKNKVGGDIPVILEGRDTQFVPGTERTDEDGNVDGYRLAVLVGDNIDVLYGNCDSVGHCAWVRGVISANGFIRPPAPKPDDGSDDSDDDDSSSDNKNLDGVVGDSTTNIPPCWR